jgi:D-amino-acid dehydrogenase
MHDVLVIGGGIVGTATAYHLVRAGMRTLLVDRHDVGRATDAGAGILSAEAYGGGSQDWYDFALEAGAYYPRLIEELQTSNADVGYGHCAKITVAIDDDEIADFERTRDRVLERQRCGHSPAAAALHEIEPQEVRRRFPFLAPVRRALYFADSARVDGRQLTEALTRASLSCGLERMQVGADMLITRGERVVGAIVAGERVEAGNVVIAAGAWSPAFEVALGVRIPVKPQRGQLVHLRLIEGDTRGWPIVEGFHGHYIVPFPDGRVVAGATRETDSGFDSENTAGGIRQVLHEAFRAAPVLADAEILEARAGLRPLCIDRMPILGPIPGVEGVFLATGHGSTGLQLGPYSGRVVADLVLGRATTPTIRSFSVSRFSTDR